MLARRTRFLRTPGVCRKPRNAPGKGVEDSSHPVRGADGNGVFFPGVRKKNAYPWLISWHRSAVTKCIMISCVHEAKFDSV
jgi:hypothetical protein